MAVMLVVTVEIVAMVLVTVEIVVMVLVTVEIIWLLLVVAAALVSSCCAISADAFNPPTAPPTVAPITIMIIRMIMIIPSLRRWNGIILAGSCSGYCSKRIESRSDTGWSSIMNVNESRSYCSIRLQNFGTW